MLYITQKTSLCDVVGKALNLSGLGKFISYISVDKTVGLHLSQVFSVLYCVLWHYEGGRGLLNEQKICEINIF